VATFRNTLRNSDLQEILLHNSLDLYYQPRFDLRNGQIIGMEALVRWPLFETHTRPVNQFLEAAKDNQLLLTMGEQILRQACTQAVRWAEMGHPKLQLALSLSYHQLAHKDFPTRVAATLEDTGLAHDQLNLEITESMLMYALEKSATTLRKLKELGTHISIINFDSSYLSLPTLRQSLINTLKISPAFIAGLGLNPDDDAIISATIAMASNLDLITVATGVETKEQARFLRREGCDHIQGPFHSQPLSVDDFTQTLELYHLLGITRGAASQLAGTIRRFHA